MAIPKEILHKQAEDVFINLLQQGAEENLNFLGKRYCHVDRITVRDTTDFVQAIRKAVLLEHQGVLKPEIDRWGKVIGWSIVD